MNRYNLKKIKFHFVHFTQFLCTFSYLPVWYVYRGIHTRPGGYHNVKPTHPWMVPKHCKNSRLGAMTAGSARFQGHPNSASTGVWVPWLSDLHAFKGTQTVQARAFGCHGCRICALSRAPKQCEHGRLGAMASGTAMLCRHPNSTSTGVWVPWRPDLQCFAGTQTVQVRAFGCHGDRTCALSRAPKLCKHRRLGAMAAGSAMLCRHIKETGGHMAARSFSVFKRLFHSFNLKILF